MKRFNDYSFYARHYKCFGSDEQGFRKIRRLNLIIGRNNTGKSALLELIRYCVTPYDISANAHLKTNVPQIYVDKRLDSRVIENSFPVPRKRDGQKMPDSPGDGARYVDSVMRLELRESGPMPFCSLDTRVIDGDLPFLENAAKLIPNPFSELRYVHIGAERDISEEPDTGSLNLQSNGSGATNIIQNVINREDRPSELIEETLLEDLNWIMGSDARFSRITVQKRNSDQWGIYLDEQAKGRISLSNSGSGLKTIVLVLIAFVVLPKIHKRTASDYVFAFEELENNLHPSLQRRLLMYVKAKLEESGAIGFLTTHSPSVIDLFSRNPDAQILHVTHDGTSAFVKPLVTDGDGFSALGDLGVKASDLLQTNGIVWVEGISDVLYLRRWMQLYCDQNGRAAPLEGSDFSFMEYGGRCLSHFDFTVGKVQDIQEEDVNLLIPALSVSRNTYLVMDSDRKSEKDKINSTKLRAEQAAGGSWITAGREIENYIASEIAGKVFGRSYKQFDSITSGFKKETGKKLDKKQAAVSIVKELTMDNWRHLDLEAQIRKLLQRIDEWNGRG